MNFDFNKLLEKIDSTLNIINENMDIELYRQLEDDQELNSYIQYENKGSLESFSVSIMGDEFEIDILEDNNDKYEQDDYNDKYEQDNYMEARPFGEIKIDQFGNIKSIKLYTMLNIVYDSLDTFDNSATITAIDTTNESLNKLSELYNILIQDNIIAYKTLGDITIKNGEIISGNIYKSKMPLQNMVLISKELESEINKLVDELKRENLLDTEAYFLGVKTEHHEKLVFIRFKDNEAYEFGTKLSLKYANKRDLNVYFEKLI